MATSVFEVCVFTFRDVRTCFSGSEVLVYHLSVHVMGWYNMISTVLLLLTNLSSCAMHAPTTGDACVLSLLHTPFTEMWSKGANIIFESSIHVLQVKV